MKISIIIPVFNEEANIEACLSALHIGDLPPGLCEILIVDNGSTDRTATIARSLLPSPILRVLSQPRSHVSIARNYGAAAAQGEILGFLDGDCFARPGWINEAIGHAQPTTVWGAHYLIPKDATWIGRTWFRHQATERDGLVSFVPAGSLFLHRADFERIGGFNPAIETAEDVEFCNNARACGMQIMAYPSLAVYHEGTPRTLTHFYRQNRWHGRHVLNVVLANWPSTRDLPLIAVTFYTLLLFWCAILCIAVGLISHRWLPLCVSLILLALPPTLLAAAKAVRSRHLLDIPALFVLYLTYLLARSASLVHSLFHLRDRLQSTRARA